MGHRRMLAYTGGRVRRFHSLRKFVSYDASNTHACTTDSGLSAGDSWSSQHLNDTRNISVSHEDISAIDCWVSWTFYCFHCDV